MASICIEPGSKEETDLCHRIDQGKHTPADLAELRKLMAERPGQLSKAADFAAMAFEDAIRLAKGTDLFAELVRDRREVLRAELGYAQALPAERLLIDEVSLAWLRHYQAELRYTQAQLADVTLAQGEYWERKVSATQRRYLRSIETFARVGKLLRSVTLQVNIGERQVNVAAGNVDARAG